MATENQAIQQTSKDVLFDTDDAIINDAHTGFKEDYLVLHSLIRKYKPKTFLEIGTNIGEGLNIIANAMSTYLQRKDLKDVLFSLDLPDELHHLTKQHPISEGKESPVGALCTFPYTQLRCDSLEFDYDSCTVDGVFIDGEHDYDHPYYESCDVLFNMPKIVIWHDADIECVWQAITDAINEHNEVNHSYDLYRVTDTRIAYAIQK